jgi:hypothetical protein
VKEAAIVVVLRVFPRFAALVVVLARKMVRSMMAVRVLILFVMHGHAGVSVVTPWHLQPVVSRDVAVYGVGIPVSATMRRPGFLVVGGIVQKVV